MNNEESTIVTLAGDSGAASSEMNQSEVFFANFQSDEMIRKLNVLTTFCTDIPRIEALGKENTDSLMIYKYFLTILAFLSTRSPMDKSYQSQIDLIYNALKRITNEEFVVDMDILFLSNNADAIVFFNDIYQQVNLIWTHELANDIEAADFNTRTYTFVQIIRLTKAMYNHMLFNDLISSGPDIDSLLWFFSAVLRSIKCLDSKKISTDKLHLLVTMTSYCLDTLKCFLANENSNRNDQNQAEKSFLELLVAAKTLIFVPKIDLKMLLDLLTFRMEYRMDHVKQLETLAVCDAILKKAQLFSGTATEDEIDFIKYQEKTLHFLREEAKLERYMLELSKKLDKRQSLTVKNLSELSGKFSAYFKLAAEEPGFPFHLVMIGKLLGLSKRIFKIINQPMPSELAQALQSAEENKKEGNIDNSVPYLAFVHELSKMVSEVADQLHVAFAPKPTVPSPVVTTRRKVRSPICSSSPTLPLNVSPEPIEPKVPEVLPQQPSSPALLPCEDEESRSEPLSDAATSDPFLAFDRFAQELESRAGKLNLAFLELQNKRHQHFEINAMCSLLKNVKNKSNALRQTAVSENLALKHSEAESSAKQTRKTYKTMFFSQKSELDVAVECCNQEYLLFDQWIKEQTQNELEAPKINWDQSVIVNPAQISYFEYIHSQQLPHHAENICRLSEIQIKYLSYYPLLLTQDPIAVITTLGIWANRYAQLPEQLIETLQASAQNVISQALEESNEALLALILTELETGDEQAFYQKLKDLELVKLFANVDSPAALKELLQEELESYPISCTA